MALGKQAKTLTKGQIEAVLGYLASTRHAKATPTLIRTVASRAHPLMCYLLR